MAIRTMRKKMKPVIFIITIGFFISMLTVIVSNISMGLRNKQYAYKINGEKIARMELERGINTVNSQYSQYFTTPIDRDDAKILATNNILEQEIVMGIGEKLKVKASNSEVKKRVEEITAQIKDKDQLKRMLKAQGFTTATFKASVKKSLIMEKTGEKVVESVKVTPDQEKAKYTEGQYREYLGKTFEEAQPAIDKSLKQQEGNKELSKMIEKEKKVAKIEDIREEYGNVKPTVEFTQDGFEITNVDVLKAMLYQAYYGVKDTKEAKTKAIENIKEEIRMAKIALDKGLKKDESLSVMNQITDLRTQLIENIKAGITPTDDELKAYFAENKDRYNTDASVDAKIISVKIEPTDADKATAKEKAEKLLKEVNATNFAEMAKKYSEGPSATNGGDLGYFGKGQMVPEFEKAAFEGKVGEVYPTLVKTQFGYHIILVEDKNDKNQVKAAHILIKTEAGADTYSKIMDSANATKEELISGKLTFDAASKKDFAKNKTNTYTSIKKDGYIRDLGYENGLTASLFAAGLDKVDTIRTDKGIYIFKKTKEVRFKEANFDELKGRINSDYKNSKLIEEMKKL